MTTRDWVIQARCAEVDTALFYPETTGLGREAKQAMAICHGCEVINECLDWALRNGEYGIWAGTSENQRKLLRRQLGIRTRAGIR